MELLKRHESGLWTCHTRLEKFDVEDLPQDLDLRRRFKPFEVLEVEGNIAVTGVVSGTGGGVNGMYSRLIGATTVPAYSNANAMIGVGDGSGGVPSVTQTDTDLTAATNKLRKAMNATYPTTPTARGVSFQSDFATGEANWVWNEWGVFNTATAGQGMLNHKGESLGTKASGVWTLTVTVGIS